MASPLPLSPQSSLTLDRDCVVLRHHDTAQDDFDRASADLFALLAAAQREHPDRKRGVIITIDGHKGDRVGYDADFFEFQQEFMLGAMGKFFTWIEMPLTGKLANPEPQRNDLPDRLRVANPDG